MRALKDWLLCYIYYGEVIRQRQKGFSFYVSWSLAVLISVNVIAVIAILLILFSQFLTITTAFIILGLSYAISGIISNLIISSKIYSDNFLMQIGTYLNKFSDDKIKRRGVATQWLIGVYSVLIFECIPIVMALLCDFKD